MDANLSMPSIYWEEAEKKGTLELFAYETDDLLKTEEKVKKTAYVYLPHGYQRETAGKIVYYMHGAGVDMEEMLCHGAESSPLKNILDNLILRGEIEPLIVVFPTYYQENYTPDNCTREKDFFLAEKFPKELIHTLLPAVEGKYLPALSCEREKQREKRAFGGFSFGGGIAWEVWKHCVDYFAFFFPNSGYYLKKIKDNAANMQALANETADFLRASRIDKRKFRIHAMTGSRDIAYEPMKAQIEAMREHKDLFDQENLQFFVLQDGLHDSICAGIYFYHALKYF